jgi:hypothetical protein
MYKREKEKVKEEQKQNRTRMEYSHYLYLRGPNSDTLWLPEDKRYVRLG